MDNTAAQIREAIEKSQQIGILVTKNPSLDVMGAALSLYLSLQEAGKRVSIASPTEPIVELTSLVGIDHVKQSIGGPSAEGDLVVSFPYKEGEIEKVSYTVEGGYLNIVVKASEDGLSFTEQDVKFSQGATGGGDVDLLFVIGAKNLADLGNLYNPDALQNATLINIDSAQDNSGYGDIVLITPQASSLSEEMASLLMGMGMEPDIDIAQNLLNGIMFGTENFQSPRTSSKAFEMSGVMMRKGAIRMNQVPSFPRPQQPAQNQPRPQQSRPQQQFGNRQPQQRDQRQNRPMPRSQMPSRPPMPQQRDPQTQNRPMPQPAPRFGASQQPTQQTQPEPQAPEPQPQAAPDDRPPADWLTPKVYKGSSNV